MDLPTYTSIWRIEKRLYKLYDFRLPMPLPIGQITVFAAIAVPYVVLLTLLGLPFNHTLIWLYILPPGAVTWLATRPVLEGKRLPELIKSQARYVAEPRVWCRMAQSPERDMVVVTARAWVPASDAYGLAVEAGEKRALPAGPDLAAPSRRDLELPPGRGAALADRDAAGDRPAGVRGARPREVPPSWGRRAKRSSWPSPDGAGRARAAAAQVPPSAVPARARPAAAIRSGPPPAPALSRAQPEVLAPAPARPGTEAPARPGTQAPARPGTQAPARPDGPVLPRPGTQAPARPAVAGPPPPWPGSPAADGYRVGLFSARPGAAGAPDEARQDSAGSDPVHREPPIQAAPIDAAARAAETGPALGGGDHGQDGGVAVPPAREPQRPAITVVGQAAQASPPAVERALAGPAARRGDARPGRVVVVPGGHRPGTPDQLQRDRARAQLPIGEPSRIVVLGCTVGAGQTATTLLTGEMLASLRPEHVAVLDLNPGASSLARRALARPALSQAASLGPSRLAVLSPARQGGDEEQDDGYDRPLPGDDARRLEFASERFDLVLADPSTAAVPRLLPMADQLVLVAPASAAAAGSIAMTFEWLEAHRRSNLAAAAIMVLNGVSRRSMPHVEQAERVCAGRCRAVVRVPWDDQLGGQAAQRAQPAAPGSRPGQRWTGLLSPATVSAYTALAGVLVASLAERAGAERAGAGQPGLRQVQQGRGRR